MDPFPTHFFISAAHSCLIQTKAKCSFVSVYELVIYAYMPFRILCNIFKSRSYDIELQNVHVTIFNTIIFIGWCNTVMTLAISVAEVQKQHNAASKK